MTLHAVPEPLAKPPAVVLQPEMAAVYARILQQTVEAACHDLMDWNAFARDCFARDEYRIGQIALALANFAEITQAIIT
jgi:hypothetical protein